jgi:hypothetical protein
MPQSDCHFFHSSPHLSQYCYQSYPILLFRQLRVDFPLAVETDLAHPLILEAILIYFCFRFLALRFQISIWIRSSKFQFLAID